MLEGNLTRLRLIEKDDLKYIREWINDPEVQYYSQEQYPSFFDYWMVKAIYSDGIKRKIYIFIIEDKQKNIIGELWINALDRKRRTAELIIVIGRREFRSRGYGRDAIETIKKFCFDELSLKSIYLKVFEFNTRAINCYKACGFKIIGKGNRKVIRAGIEYNELIMGVLKNSSVF